MPDRPLARELLEGVTTLPKPCQNARPAPPLMDAHTGPPGAAAFLPERFPAGELRLTRTLSLC